MEDMIKKIKTSLAELGSPDSELRQLYKQALDSNRTQLMKTITALDEKSAAAKNKMQSAAMIAKKNTGIEAEKQGLLGAGAIDVLQQVSQKKLSGELGLLQTQVGEQKQLLLDKSSVEEEKHSAKLADTEKKQKSTLENQLLDLEKAAQKAKEKPVIKPVPKYNPKVTAKELAKSILERYPGDKEKANAFVAGLNELYSFDDEYLRDLGFAIEAYSIKDTMSDSSGVFVPASKIKQLVAEGEAVFKDAHQKIYRTLSEKGESGLSLSKSAVEMAKLNQMDFFYRSSSTKAQFELVCKQAGLSAKEIEEYEQRASFINNHTDGHLELGEYLRKEG